MKTKPLSILFFLICIVFSLSAQTGNIRQDSIKIIQPGDSVCCDTIKDTIPPVRSYPTGNTIGDPILVTSIPSSATHQTYTNTVNTNDYSNVYVGQNTKDVYYVFQLPKEMIVTLTHDGSNVYDTYMHLLGSSIQLIAENDDYSGDGHCYYTTQSYIRMVLPAGFYFVVSEGKTYDGYITTNMTFDEVPTGDSRTLPIVAGTYSGSFSYSNTQDTHTFSNRMGQATNDVYYTFTLSTEMNVTITHQGSSLQDTFLYLLNSSGSVIESNDNYSGGGHCSDTCQAFINRQLSPGTYYVVSEGKTANGIITTNIIANTEAGYDYPVIPSTYSAEPGTAVGAMGGFFGVSPMGGATYSIPIAVPQGVDGLQPQLAITYNSQAGNGLCGYGASLSGMSSITRGPKDIFHDGTAQGMKYLADDALYLDGVRLILRSGTAGRDGATYNPESDPFTVVITHGICYNSADNTWYEVQGSNGMTYWYGHDPYSNSDYNSRLSYTVNSNRRTHSWYLCRAQQPTGNYMIYSYQQNNNCVYPYQITYGNNVNHTNSLSNVVEFTYDSRPDSILIRFDGQKGSMQRRLTNITGKTNANTFRSYDLNYSMNDGTSYKFSRLVSVTEKNAQNQTLPATQLNWSFLPAVSFNSYSPSISPSTSLLLEEDVPFQTMTVFSGDLNSDGLDDLIEIIPIDVNNGYPYTIVDGAYASLDQNGNVTFSNSNQHYTMEYLGSLGSLIMTEIAANMNVDIDGDGTNEMIVPFYDYATGDYARIIFNVVGPDFDHKYKLFPLQTISKPLCATGDFDNDGRSEIVYLETEKKYDVYNLCVARYDNNYGPNYNSPLVGCATQDLTFDSDPKHLYASDMNGDGLVDLFVVCEDSYAIIWNHGGGMNNNTFLNSGNNTGTLLKDSYCLTPGDFNGDGLLDVLTKEPLYQWYFYINNGDGSFSKTLSRGPSSLDQIHTSYNSNNCHCEILDFDGDGKSDVVLTETKHISGTGVFISTDTYWLHSTGTALVQVHHASSSRADDALSNRYLTGDFDGDGRMELVNYGYDCAHGVNANSDPVWRIYKNSSLTAQSGKVTSVSGDFGATTNITYSTLADQNIYTRGTDESYPAPRYTIPLNVVKQTTQSNGVAGSMTTQYNYEGLKAHLRGRGLLGFSKTITTNTTTGVTTESGVTQWDTAHYIPKITYSRTTIGSDVSQATITLSISDTYNSSNRKIYFAYPSQTVETDMDGFTTSTYHTCDTVKGYVLSDSTVYGTNMYRAVRYRQYTDTKVGGVYRPQTVVTSQRHPNDTSPFSVTTNYTYNSTTGTVSTKVDNYGTTAPLTTSYSYDSWGNLTSELSTFSGNTTPCTTYYSYDATHRFPVRIYTSPASSVRKYTYDTWGNVLTEQDSINTSINNTVTNTYDGWGNITCTQKAGDGEVTYTRGWGSDASQRWFVLEQGTGRPWVKTWYDNQGREVLMESIGPKNVSVSSTTTYSYSNHELTVSSTDVNGGLSLTSRKKYDVRGRVMNEIYPGGRRKTYGYLSNGSIRIVTVTEDGNTNRTTTYRYDAMGNLFKVEGPASSSIENTFSSNGGILQATTNNATWTFQYDDRGNRTSITDPDAGTTTYIYDAFGRETSRTDARGVVFSTNYDYLGRVSNVTASQSGSSETISYTYGNSNTDGTGQMRLVSESLNGWTKTYTYDAYGRVTDETMFKTGVISRSKSYTYDSNGLLVTSTQPGSKVFTYTYDAYGNLTGVNGAGGAVKWNLTGYTGRRTVSETVLDNNTSYPFVKTHLLDQYGYLDSIRTVQHDDWVYQDEDYNFSPMTGNLTSANNRMSDGETWNFVYDNLDRLTAVQENNEEIMEMVYAANGNISYKTDLGDYTYSSFSKPHAVQSIDNDEQTLTLYGHEITYNLWGKVSTIWHYDQTDFYYYTAEYGPDLEKVSSRYDKTYHIEYEKFQWGDYEEKTTDGVTTSFYYVNGADGLAGLHTVSSTQGGTVTHSAAAITDHLGTITAMVDNNDWCYDVHYDVWGNRVINMPFYYSIERGFTGHDHIDGIGLIDMRGRMYDPHLGRFLSPDAFIQSPTDPQNYNRYSYCLNNPLKYTDPSGEVFGETLFTFAIDLFTTAFFKGGLDFSSIGAMRDAWKDFDPTASWSKTNKSWKMSVGMYKTDSNKNFWGRAWQLVSRFTWEAPQSYLGSTVNQVHNIFGGVKSVDYYGGATVVESYAEKWGAFTIGNYINGERDIKASTDNALFRHEYGHYLQSMSWGALYIPRFGLPSFWDAMGDKTLDYPVEVDANKRAFKYFSKYIEGFTTYDTENDYWDSKWDFRNDPISSDGSRNNARSGMSSWKEGLLRFQWYDFFANDPFGLINHNIVYQLMKY